ncbi:MAG: hypothetical protein D3903_18945 [Candidatus Electrothrix sp. GM3_4]|nr:hypothetical protein [Candidatus Electrothrix sp. GM3_4]
MFGGGGAKAATEGVKDVLTFYEELKQQAIDEMESDRDDNDGGTMKDARTHNQKLSIIEQNVALLREAINQGADGAVNEAESAVDEAMTMVRKLAKDFEDRSGIDRDDMEGEELEGEELP